MAFRGEGVAEDEAIILGLSSPVADRLIGLDEAAEAEREAEVWEDCGVVQGRGQRLELDCMSRLGLGLLLSSAEIIKHIILHFEKSFFFYSPDVDCIGESLAEAVYFELVVIKVVLEVGRGGAPGPGRERGRPLEVHHEVLRGEWPLVYHHLARLLVLRILLGLFIILLLIMATCACEIFANKNILCLPQYFSLC